MIANAFFSVSKRHQPTRDSATRRTAMSCLPLVAAVAFAFLVAAGASAWTTNLAQLDNGKCGTDLQIGSDKTASSSATPTFWLMGDGGLSSYQAFIDGVSVGTFNSDGYANVCIRTSSRLAEGTHVLTANELAPHSTYTITPFNFSVDTVAPSAPTTPALDLYSNVPGNGVSKFHNVTLVGSSAPNAPVQVYAARVLIGGAKADASGHWSAATAYLANGTYTVTAAALDAAGNKSPLSGALTLTINDQATTATTTTIVQTTTTTKPPATTTSTVNTTTTTRPPTTTTTVVKTVPGAPTGVAGKSSGKNVSLSWSAPANGGSAITSYVVYRGRAPGTETQLTSVSGTSLSFTDKSVVRRVAYYYRVSARNAIGPGPLSSEVVASSH
ncbi:MAG: Ig-like domain-containing protein [Actinomycetota bacterium]|nr:Ig-like domain-containing protein [Actinomycetota bacterium]